MGVALVFVSIADEVTTAMSWDGDEDDLDYLIGAHVGLISYGLFGAVYRCAIFFFWFPDGCWLGTGIHPLPLF